MQAREYKPCKSRYDSTRMMKSLQYQGTKSVKLVDSPVPLVTEPTDAVVKITVTTICGSDLHLYHGCIPQLKKGDILGHEAVGIVTEVGPLVQKIQKGDRVVVSSVIACGFCENCKRGEWSCCDTTNTSLAEVALYGHHTSGLFGYSQTFGGYDGCQAEYVRVPIADVNLFPVPNEITDTQAVLVSDALCTAYHGTELADVQPGDKVVVFGCGPVGLLTIMWSFFRGASRVIAIDVDPQRLGFADKYFGAETINGKELDPVETVKDFMPGGPDKVIDCVGFRFPETFLHKLQMKIGLETDSPNIINAAIKMVRKNGRITLIGDYAAYANQVNIGAFMEKHLTINGGQLWPHKYYQFIFDALIEGKINPTVIFTHSFPLSEIERAYEQFDKHEGGIIKAFILPDELYLQSGEEMKQKVIE